MGVMQSPQSPNGYAIVGAALLSAFSVLSLIFVNVLHPRSRFGGQIHIPAVFGSLIASNLLQAIGTIINTRWVLLGGVEPGSLCSFQGGIKQAGNVGTAVWSFTLALLAFCLLFLRARVSTRLVWSMIAVGWSLIAFVVAIGPLALRTKALGPYFGPSGFWCWISESYPDEQVCLEYMFEWMSAFFSFALYVTVLLRVRGNLSRDTMGKWSLRWVPSSESWQLGFARDYLDSSTFKMAANIVWYPVIYTVLIVPISIARFASYAGAPVPDEFIFLADLIYALGGFTNLVLFLGTRRHIPDPSTIPDPSMPRLRLDKASRAGGITPFTLATVEDAEEQRRVMATAPSDRGASVSYSEKSETETLDHRVSMDSHVSIASRESTLPLNPRW
ncbi:hypothetical protein BC827DRAFT_1152477 [Russula dissimulans]|nr:hypothetical protein BC827DRAFT_1152477 [Russula dissimulans]